MKVSLKSPLSLRYIDFIKCLILIISIGLTCSCFLEAQVLDDTVEVGAGWNMIGSLASGVASEILRCEPDTIITSAFFTYNPGGGYEAKDTLKKGAGYWVKVKADGLIIFSGSGGEWVCGNTIEYSDKVYNTVLIGSQCWLKENLDVGTRIDASSNQTNNGSIEKYCYNNDTANCDTYGGLYQWNEAMQYTTLEGAKGICPTDWHVPTIEDYTILYNAVGGSGNALKAIGQGTGAGAGTNTSGFSALLAGAVIDGTFSYLTELGVIWSSIQDSPTDAFAIVLEATSNVFQAGPLTKLYACSVRCIKD